MINKGKLTSLISKYYLNGLNNQVKWRIKDNQLTVYAGESGKVCKVVLRDFPLEDGELGIFDTGKLVKLMSITAGDLMLGVEKMKSVFTKLYIKDSHFDLTYSLADVLILGKNIWYDEPQDYNIKLKLSSEDIDHLIKAKNALGEVENMLIKTTIDLDKNPICEFIFGDNTGFSNKITYQIGGGDIKDLDLEIPYNSNIFKDILASNKDQETCILTLSSKSTLKLDFKSSDIESEYFLARNE